PPGGYYTRNGDSGNSANGFLAGLCLLRVAGHGSGVSSARPVDACLEGICFYEKVRLEDFLRKEAN
ncbi:MAG: hypothetical protein L6Q26_07710, partial [Anaerolineales bacterium]|nr:hypothetical protein [Anaerolineales bacterium]